MRTGDRDRGRLELASVVETGGGVVMLRRAKGARRGCDALLSARRSIVVFLAVTNRTEDSLYVIQRLCFRWPTILVSELLY